MDDAASRTDLVAMLTQRACWKLLTACTFGRITVSNTGGYPTITPVNFAVDGRTIVFRTVDGVRLAGVAPSERVAFEADAHNDAREWSVCVQGLIRPIADRAETERCDRLPLLRWIPAAQCTYYRVIPRAVAGTSITRPRVEPPRIRTEAILSIEPS